jgi:23S rRNA pseudouridine1911/1915/1917 synthase
MSSVSETRHIPPVPPESAGLRLDKWLAQSLPALSRSRLQALIAEGRVVLAGLTITDPSARVKPGQTFDLHIPPASDPTPKGQAMPLAVVYEDEHLIVIDKPPGLVVHPAPGNLDRTLVNALIAHCGDSLSGIGGVKRPGIVHRIDKDTSGLIVAAKTDAAHHGLADLFARHDIERSYAALVWGVPVPPAGKIEGAIGRHPADRKRMAIVKRGGKPALTRYRVLNSWEGAVALVECRLETGRTHQIRVHMASIGHPLVGDALYARGRKGKMASLSPVAQMAISSFPRQALHAKTLGFIHPITGKPMQLSSHLSCDFNNLIISLDSDQFSDNP